MNNKSPFYFDGSMSEEVLRNYASRAVTHQILCIDNTVMDEDIRLILNIGAKFIGRAAHFSWAGHLTMEQIDDHYSEAERNGQIVHAADPEIILQAGVFEIIYKDTVEAVKIPDFVFEAFELPVEDRHFNWEVMLFPDDFDFRDEGQPWLSRGGRNFWNENAAWPFIGSLETQMYFYYLICRYIDINFEAVHLGQADGSTGNDPAYYSGWDRVTTLARTYAKTHARRGIILFDCHTSIGSENMKIGDRLILDITGAGMVPIDTVKEDGVLKCKICDYTESWCTWIGRSAGGRHPLGFEIETCFTIIEMDNYGRPGPVGEYNENYSPWGYDDITWFTLQPEWYRNEFLLKCDRVLKTTRLDKSGKQVYFLQPQLRRNLCLDGDAPVCVYTPSKAFDKHYLETYAKQDDIDVRHNVDGTYTLTSNGQYRANTQSDRCPNGFGQEEVIRQIFLGT